METLYYIVGIVVGLICGIGIGRYLMKGGKEETIGTLRLDRSDPDEPPYLFLELDRGGMETIHRKKTVQLRVNLKDYIGAREERSDD